MAISKIVTTAKKTGSYFVKKSAEYVPLRNHVIAQYFFFHDRQRSMNFFSLYDTEGDEGFEDPITREKYYESLLFVLPVFIKTNGLDQNSIDHILSNTDTYAILSSPFLINGVITE